MKAAGFRSGLAACCAAVVVAALPVAAQPVSSKGTGTLDRIKSSGKVRIGYREEAVPFSFAAPGRPPEGYSLDLCQAIVEEAALALKASLEVEYRPVTPADRIELVTSGRIDLECGSTTETAERRREVAFSPTIYLAATRLLVKRGSAVASSRELPGRTVAVVAGTTAAATMQDLASGRLRGLRVAEVADYPRAFAVLEAGQVDAFAADDVILAGLLSQQRLRGRFITVGERLSLEPYAIAYARDDAEFQRVVRAAFRRMAASRELRATYDKWFVRPLPSGLRMDLPLIPELADEFAALAR